MTPKFIKLRFKENKFLNYIPNKKNIILDYGCGEGIFTKNILKNKKIHKVLLYDKEIGLKSIIKKKYKYCPKIKWVKNYKNYKFNIVLINSVSQYISENDWKNLIKSFFKNKKLDLIIVSDIPKYYRAYELFYLLIFKPQSALRLVISYLNFNYISSNFYFKRLSKVNIRSKKFNYKIESNFLINDLPRYSLIFFKKNY